MAAVPSRDELLEIVRKHSQLLGQTVVDQKGRTSDPELDMNFWREIFDMFFIRGVAQEKSANDDLVFFVRLLGSEYIAGDFKESEYFAEQSYFVRRWAPKLAKVIGESDWEVDWRRSFYLNLIAHTKYSITVAICSREALQNHQKVSATPLAPVYKVTKTVYASPTRVNFQVNSKASETIPAYPDIYFVVDDYEDTFEAVVLTDADHCYCVLLNASGGAAFASGEMEDNGPESKSNSFVLADKQGSGIAKVTLFSGFVNYDMVHAAFAAGKSGLSSLLHLPPSSDRSERLVMRGPGGRGEVDVIVSGVPGEADDKPEPPSPILPSKGGVKFAVGTIMRRAVTVAKHAYVAASTSNEPQEILPLRCSLLSLSLPWEVLAYDLLFKGSKN